MGLFLKTVYLCVATSGLWPIECQNCCRSYTHRPTAQMHNHNMQASAIFTKHSVK